MSPQTWDGITKHDQRHGVRASLTVIALIGTKACDVCGAEAANRSA
jgi:hypothetical protein